MQVTEKLAHAVNLFAPFDSIEKAADGVIVSGVASAPVRDADGELITTECMRLAAVDFMKWAALRLQHRADSPIGVVTDLSVDSAGATRFTAKVVDENAIKLLTSVPPTLKGASIGGRVLKRNAQDSTIVERISWIELSLVDRPSCPAAVARIAKVEAADALPDADDGGAIAKVAARLNGAMRKVAALETERDEALAKAAALGRRVQKFMGERDAARSRLAKAARAHAAEVGRLTAERDRYFVQAAAKGSLRAVEITKAEDNGSAPERRHEPEDPLMLIKAAQRRPGQLFDPPRR